MPTESVSITASWNSIEFQDVRELSWSYGGARQGRDVEWLADQGSVSLTCLGTANTNIANFGKRELLEISGGGVGLTTYAVWESVSYTPQLNGVTQYTVTLKIVDN